MRYAARIFRPVQQPYYRGHIRLQRAEAVIKKTFLPILGIYTVFYAFSASDTAALQGLQQALALRCYSLHYGKYPDRLQQLVPGYLPKIPLDPFTGRQYAYRSQGKGFVLYSLGEDLKDDGGQGERTRIDSRGVRHILGYPPLDIVWSLSR